MTNFVNFVNRIFRFTGKILRPIIKFVVDFSKCLLIASIATGTLLSIGYFVGLVSIHVHASKVKEGATAFDAIMSTGTISVLLTILCAAVVVLLIKLVCWVLDMWVETKGQK